MLPSAVPAVQTNAQWRDQAGTKLLYVDGDDGNRLESVGLVSCEHRNDVRLNYFIFSFPFLSLSLSYQYSSSGLGSLVLLRTKDRTVEGLSKY